MRKVTIEEYCDLLEVMTITHSIDHGFAITHFGHVAGTPTIVISTYRGEGDSFVIQ